MIAYFFKSAFATLKYNKFRTLLTGLGIFVGVASVIVIVAFSDSLSHHLSNEFNRKVTLGLADSVEGTDFTEIITSDGIRRAAEEIRKRSDVLSFEQAPGSKRTDVLLPNGSRQYGVDVAFDDTVAVSEGVGFDRAPGNAVVAYCGEGSDVSLYHVGDALVVGGVVYTVVGTTSDLTATLYFPQRLGGAVPYREAYDVAAFYLTTDQSDPGTVDAVLERLNAELSGTARFVNYTEGDTESLSGIFATISLFLSLIASISLVVSAINIVNIMYISILERANEIAVYRSLGMTKGMVVYLFLVESFLIVAVFAALGYAFGLLLSWLILAVLQIPLYASLYSLLLIVAVSIVLGIGAGIKPALKAANTNLSILLR